jgi:hypothetical protein
MWREMWVCKSSHPAAHIVSGIELCFLFIDGVWVYHVFNLYLKMPRTKTFASKAKFRGNKYVRVKKETGFSEKRQTQSDQSDKSSCVKHNPNASNEKIHLTSVNAEIYVGQYNFCKSERWEHFS